MQRLLLLLVPAVLTVGGCDEPNPDDDISPVDPAAEGDAPEALAAAEDDEGRPGGRGGKGRRMLMKLDIDGDGAISIAEAEGHFIADKFAKIDGNGDGMLAADELAAMRRHGGKHGGKHGKGKKSPEERAAKMLERLDADGDGAISQEEAAAHERIAGKFAAIDADSDGKLTKDELIAFKREHHNKHRGEGEKEGPVAG